MLEPPRFTVVAAILWLLVAATIGVFALAVPQQAVSGDTGGSPPDVTNTPPGSDGACETGAHGERETVVGLVGDGSGSLDGDQVYPYGHPCGGVHPRLYPSAGCG